MPELAGLVSSQKSLFSNYFSNLNSFTLDSVSPTNETLHGDWVESTQYNYIRVAIYADVNGTLELDFCFTIGGTVTTIVAGSNLQNIFLLLQNIIPNKYVRVRWIPDIGENYTTVQISTILSKHPIISDDLDISLSILANSGLGVFLYDSINYKIKSLTSDDNSIVITNNSDSIDLSVNFPPAGDSVYKLVSTVISPVDINPTNGILNGENNSITATSQNTSIVGGNTNTSLINTLNGVIAGGINNQLGGGRACAILASNACQINNSGLLVGTSNFNQNNSIISSTNSTITGGSGGAGNVTSTSIISSSGASVSTRNSYSSMISSQNCNFNPGSAGFDYASMISCSNTNMSGGNMNSCVISSVDSTFGSNGSGNSSRRIMIGGFNTTFQSNNARDICTIGGYLNNGGFGGILMLGDSGTTTMTATSANRLFARYQNGYTLFTNSAQTTGVVLNANSSSWGVVSDVNKKNIIKEANYSVYYDKMKNVPCYVFTYVDDLSEKKYLFPTAQDFHAQYSNANETYEAQKLDENGNPMFDENGNPVMENLPKKDICQIEYNDIIGALMCTIKSCQLKIDDLQTRVSNLEGN